MSSLPQRIRKQIATYILAAFGLVAGLAWNEAIKGLIDYLYPLDQNSLPAKFIYASIVTIIVVVAGIYLSWEEK